MDRIYISVVTATAALALAVLSKNKLHTPLDHEIKLILELLMV